MKFAFFLVVVLSTSGALAEHAPQPGEGKAAQNPAPVTLESTEKQMDALILNGLVKPSTGGMVERIKGLAATYDVTPGPGLLGTVEAIETAAREKSGYEAPVKGTGLIGRVEGLETFLRNRGLIDFYRKTSLGGKTYLAIRTKGTDAERLALIEAVVDQKEKENRVKLRLTDTVTERVKALEKLRPDVIRSAGLPLENREIIEGFEAHFKVEPPKGATLTQRLERCETVIEAAHPAFLEAARSRQTPEARLVALQRRIRGLP